MSDTNTNYDTGEALTAVPPMSALQQFQRDLERVPTDEFKPSEAFFELTRRLKREYTITRGALILERHGKMTVVSTWHHGIGGDGLLINLPDQPSLFRQVFDDGRVFSENFVGCFSGNFFEQKLLLDEDTRSFVLQPLKSDGQVIGLIGYSSEDPHAFALFEDGTLEETADILAARIAKYRVVDDRL